MTLIIVFLAASFLTSLLVISACVLSARISQEENFVEQHESEMEAAPPVAPRSYSLKG
jgi:hypothetical protein